jgi:amino acid adenylation domain-containing protein
MQKLPLLGTQLGIWLADQVAARKNTYVIAHAVDLAGPLDVALMREAIGTALAEADTVSARYLEDETGIWQLPHNAGSGLEIVDLRNQADPQAIALATMKADIATDLPAAGERPLVRQILFRLADANWVWYQRYHHIMLDGFSFTALTRRIAEIYSRRLGGELAGASPFGSVSTVLEEYRDYAQSDARRRDGAFWQDYCRDLPVATKLSLRNGEAGPDQVGGIAEYAHALPATILQKLEAIAATGKLTTFDILMAAITAYLYRASGNADQVVGVPFMRRMGSTAINSVAPVVNVLPVRLAVDGAQTLLAFAQTVKSTLRDARRHQRYDAEQIQRDLGLVGSGRALYGPVVNYRMFDYDLRFGDIAGLTRHLATGPVDDIEFGLLIRDGIITIELRAETALYDMADLRRHAARLAGLLEAFCADSDIQIHRLPMLDASETQLIATHAHGPVTPCPPDLATIIDVFTQQAVRTPDATALIFGQTHLSFATLSARVFRLARYLIARGVGPGDIVAVAVPRSDDAVIAMLAVLASGAAHMPLDLDYPRERLSMMCEDARPSLALTTSAQTPHLPDGLALICLDDPAVIAACADCSTAPITDAERKAPLRAAAIAYVIFTSGSTGRPKGVMNTHGSLLSLFLSHHPTIYAPALGAVAKAHPGRPLRAAHTHSFAFDSSWLQIFWMLHGQELHIIDEDLRRDADELVRQIQARGIDALDLSPSFATQMLNCGLMAEGHHHPTVLLLGGEAASPALWSALRAHPELQAHNLYGPTEYTVDTLRAPLSAATHPVVGRPIGNTHAYVLDHQLQPVGIGIAGELYVSGSGLAKGYLGRPDLTAQRFLANPFLPGAIMYRTGDLVRWNGDGMIDYIGRRDHQVKVRGYRVETPEIEAALQAMPWVQTALVIAEAINDSHRLIGYCTVTPEAGADKQAIAAALRHALRDKLPDFMIPAAIVVLDAFPLTVNSKVDRSRLPAPSVAVETTPATPQEALVCKVLAQALKLPALGADSDFFALGGDSITAIVVCSALRAEGFLLRPRDIFAGRDARHMAEAMTPLSSEETRHTIADDLPAADLLALRARYGAIAATVPVLPTQKGMLFHAQLGDKAGSYNAFTRLELDGSLDVARLRRAFDTVLRRHPQLGGVFELEQRDEPLLVIPDLATDASNLWPWEEHDLTHLPSAERAAAGAAIETAATQKDHFAPSFRRLLSAVLIRSEADRHILLIIVHHLMIDGWSTPLVLRDLLAAYASDAPLAPVPSRYADVVSQLAARDPAPSHAVWRETLAGVTPTLLFEQASPSSAMQEYALSLPSDISETLLSRAREHGVTLNVLMQGVWALALGAMAGRDEVVFGTPVAGRSAPVDGIADQVGLFLNTIPVRVTLRPEVSLWEQLADLQSRHALLMEHDALGLGNIQALVGAGALFDTLLVVENYPDNDYLGYDLDGLSVGNIHNRGYSHYPLALLVLPGDTITLLIENRGAIDDAQALAQSLAGIIKTLARQPELPVAALPLWTDADRALVETVNATARPLPPITLRDLLIAQVGRTPDTLALIDAENELTFRQMRHQVLHLAQRLRQAGVRTGDVVAVALPRSARLTLALHAIIEVGAAFLPLDLSYPSDRLTYMLADASPRVAITDQTSQSLLGATTPLVLFDHLADPKIDVRDLSASPDLTPDHPAYVLYTSGTTGRPKGVVISHGAIVNRILWMQHQYPLDHTDVVLQKTPCGFDVSVWEFFWASVVGAKLVMAPPDAHRDPMALLDLIERHGVTTLHFVPSMLALFLASAEEQPRACTSLRLVFCSGEALPKKLARDFAALSSAELHNLYGPTEAAVDVTFAPAMDEAIAGNGGVPIGLPVWNTQLRILDHLLRPTAIGVPGELYLAGAQLATGYLGRADLTSSRFVADPQAPGQRMYRTGDLARWLPNGQVDYLGRTDHQIKIRGQRVELGEIEVQLENLPGIRQAVVVALALKQSSLAGADERQLAAYLVPETGTPLPIETFPDILKAVLPLHMIPAAFVELDALPLSPNGKLDRKALPLPASPTTTMGGRAPAEGLESRIAAIFTDLLGHDSISADDDFFAIGGHSLLAMRLAARIRRDLKRQLAVGQIMVMSSVAKLAKHLASGEAVGEMAKSGFEPVIRLREGSGSPLICIYPGSGVSWQYSVLSRYLNQDIPIIGLQSPRPNGPIATSASMDELCDRQLAILREVQPNGPYYLLGYSLGGTIAYGLATRLRRLGENVQFLGLLDTYPAEEHDWTDPEGAEANLGAEREQEQLINEAMADVVDDEFRREKAEMFGHIFENYRDGVKLLSQAKTPDYGGHVTLFVAGKSVPPGIDPDTCWTQRAGSVAIHHLPHCSHDDIVSPASLEILGPLINALIEEADTGPLEHARQQRAASS